MCHDGKEEKDLEKDRPLCFLGVDNDSPRHSDSRLAMDSLTASLHAFQQTSNSEALGLFSLILFSQRKHKL
ncbi:hypothetical protein VNO78_19588 [Psophocarpus tetragonolobus]|uniref:Uncharacterized protein n=1 Tax=Psophocarpus tetragonolobus TaxID=3891 RepID=A0AAN9XGE0_PSOTE